jgi:hypothetical protein
MEKQQEISEQTQQSMYNPGRKDRRRMEKTVGLTKEYRKMNERKRAEVRQRKQAAGREIHLRNVQEYENRLIQQDSERYARILQNMIAAGYTEDQADNLLSKNIEIEEKRAAKKAARA